MTTLNLDKYNVSEIKVKIEDMLNLCNKLQTDVVFSLNYFNLFQYEKEVIK